MKFWKKLAGVIGKTRRERKTEELRLRHEEEERRERERIEHERRMEEARLARLEREREKAEQREREEKERREVEEKARWLRDDMGVNEEVFQAEHFTTYTVQTPEEVEELIRQAEAAGKRVSWSVKQKDGWHVRGLNKGRNIPGGEGMTAQEALKRIEKHPLPRPLFEQKEKGE